MASGSLYAYKTDQRVYDISGMKHEGPVWNLPQQKSAKIAAQKTIKHNDASALTPTRTDDSDLVTVTITFPNVGEGGEWTMPWSIRIFNESGYYESFDVDPYDEDFEPIPMTSIDIEIPEGNYEVLCPFERLNSENMTGMDPVVYYIAENVMMTDGTIVELKPEESTICLEMVTVNPDGEPTTFGIGGYDEDYNWVVEREGNITDDYVIKQILLNGESMYTLNSNCGGFIITSSPQGTFNPQANRNFYVNAVSDRYTFRVTHCMASNPGLKNGCYLTVTQAKGAVAGTYTNSPDYTFEEAGIVPTPAADEYPLSNSVEGPVQTYRLTPWAYGAGNAHELRWTSPDIWKIWSSGPAEDVDDTKNYFSYEKALSDMLMVFEEEWDDEVYEYQLTYETTGPRIFPLANTDGGDICQFPHSSLSVEDQGYALPATFPGNRGFLSEFNKTKLLPGQSAPLLISIVEYDYNWWGEGFNNYLSYLYTGRVGEDIGSDWILAKGYLKANGETVVDTPREFYSWMCDNPEVTGKFEAKISTDNFEIDGIKGGNTATVTFDRGGSDPFPPSVTMLQLRDTSDAVIQTFGYPDEGVMLLSAADFEVMYGEPNYEGYIPTSYLCSVPANVSATVRPTGVTTDAFEAIELTEEPEYFTERGFGAFYKASLGSIKADSPTGWFDLTITVEDTAGNRQTQTLSPAFKIESLKSSVSTIRTEKVKVVGNSIIVDGDAQIHDLSGKCVDGRNLNHGIYFVVSRDETLKVII